MTKQLLLLINKNVMQTDTKELTTTKIPSSALNKAAYIAFLLVGIFYLVKKDFSNAVIYWGIGLVFDPFNQQIPFNKRPFWQQTWLIVHLAITFAVLILMF